MILAIGQKAFLQKFLIFQTHSGAHQIKIEGSIQNILHPLNSNECIALVLMNNRILKGPF